MVPKHLNIAQMALDNLWRFRLRSAVVLLCLWAILVPFLTALAILEGIKSEAALAVDAGADLYVSLDQYGQNAVIPVEMADKIRQIEGVRRVVPRAIGRGFFFDKLCLVVGLPLDSDPLWSMELIDGDPPANEGELMVGEYLARVNELRVGQLLSLSDSVNYLVGVFTSEIGIWSSNLILMGFEDVCALFHQEGYATDLLVYTRPGYEQKVTEQIYRAQYQRPGAPLLRLQTKSLVREYFDRGYNLKGGIFAGLYVFGFAVAIPTILVASGLGLNERRREVGILKSMGWQTHEVIELVFFENLLLSLIAAPSALLIAFAWVKGLNGFFLAQFFIAELGSFAKFPVPASFLPAPLFLGLALALVITLVGSLFTTWKTAITPPMEAIR